MNPNHSYAKESFVPVHFKINLENTLKESPDSFVELTSLIMVTPSMISIYCTAQNAL